MNETYRRFLMFGALLALFTQSFAQSSVMGRLIGEDEVPVADVKIEELGTANESWSEVDGTFHLHYSSGSSVLRFTHGQYDTLHLVVDSMAQTIYMTLRGNPFNLAGYTGYTDFTSINPNKHLDKMPYIGGEADVNRQLQMLPGVEHGYEGFSNLIIRGGNIDENLMLYNGTPVYNYNHLFGFTSIFHADGIHDVRLYKGNSPSKYGGRLSSVMEVETAKSSAFSGISGELEFSPVSGGFFIRDIQRNKSYFTLSARRSYLDLLIPVEIRLNNFNLYLYDVQLNLGRTLKDGSELEFSFMTTSDLYFSSFQFEPDSSTELQWGNRFVWRNNLGSVKWSKEHDPTLHSSHSLHFSQFNRRREETIEIFDPNLLTVPTTSQSDDRGIREYIARTDWEYHMNNRRRVDFGSHLQVKTYRTSYGEYESVNYPNTPDEFEVIGSKAFKPSLEWTFYGEWDQRMTDAFNYQAGLRATWYTYGGWSGIFAQPRLHLNYRLDGLTALKLAYSRQNQFTRLIAVSGTEDPYSFWVPATERVRPAQLDIAEIGIDRRLGADYSLSLNAFYKQMNNIHVVRNYFNVIIEQDDWQDELTLGSGTSYGVELMVQKNVGNLTGWLGYVYGKTDRLFDELSEDPFPFDFDRRHMVKLYANYTFNRFVSFGMNFLYGSGQLFSIPGGKFLDINGDLQLDYASFNNYRSDNYSRLDLSVVKVRSRSKANQEYKFYLYNIMGVKNPYSLTPGFEVGYTQFTISRYFVGTIPGIAYVIHF